MIRLYLKFTLVMSVVMVLLMTAIRARPYDDQMLRTLFLPPENCPAPCLFGIQPGQTTINRAMNLMQRNAWMQDVEAEFALQINARFISWKWRDNTLDVLNSQLSGHLRLNPDNTVRDFTFATAVTLGDIWLWLGPPEKQFATLYRGVEDRVRYAAIYPENNLIFGFARTCPLRSLWHSRVSVVAVDDRSVFVGYHPQDFPAMLYHHCRAGGQ